MLLIFIIRCPDKEAAVQAILRTKHQSAPLHFKKLPVNSIFKTPISFAGFQNELVNKHLTWFRIIYGELST